MYKIRFTPNAKKNLEDIGEYIGTDNPYYSKRVVLEIGKSIRNLENFPLLGKEIEESVRQIVNSKYRFKVVYQFSKNIISIQAIFREQRDWR